MMPPKKLIPKWIVIISILIPNYLFATVIPQCGGGGNVEDNVEDGVEIDGGECGELSANIGTLSGNVEVKDGQLTIDGDITTLSGNITICSSCTLTINGDIGNITGSITNEGTLLITGSLTAAGKLEVKGGGSTTLDGGSFESTGDGVVIESGATVNLENGSSITTSSGTENNGTINSDNSGNSINGGVDSSGGGTVDPDLGDCSSDCGDASLPVELVSFKGEVTNFTANLQWRTATELNNQGFEIQKSLDGESYEVIGFISGNGTSSQPHSYSFKDPSFNSFAYYRLRQIDFDGRFEYSPTIFMNEELKNQIRLGPNPYNGGQLNIYSSFPNTTVSVFDLNGKVYLLEADVLRLEQVVVNLENGLYHVQFTNPSRNQFKMKLVVNKP